MIKLSQSEYINSILQQFDMTECNPVVTPADKGAHLQNDESVPLMMKEGARHSLGL